MYIAYIIYRTKRCTDFIDTKEILKLERVGCETEFPSAHVEIAVNIWKMAKKENLLEQWERDSIVSQSVIT